MGKILIGAFAGLLLVGCGGGGGVGGSNAGITQSAPVLTTVAAGTLCGVGVGAKLLEGTVTEVHDGDTVTLNAVGTSYKVRLDTIDAPELAQPFGGLSQSTLANAVLGKSVKVAYGKTDQYGRLVGAVFTDSCQFVNLNQVSAGMAWFYKAYQCEVSASVRHQFAQSQDNAVAAKLGLWAQSEPEAPWFYRNGVEPVTPVCASDSPIISANSALSAVGPSTAANSSSLIPSSSGSVAAPKICYTGPLGGTYTLSPTGNKNYGGC